jgi:hypothetical protein
MENINRLRILLTIILVLGAAGIFLVPFILAFSDQIKIDGEIIKEGTPVPTTEIVVISINYMLFFIGIYKLREAIVDFYEKQLFNDVISKSFKYIGSLILIGIICDWAIRIIAEIIFSSHLHLFFKGEYLIYAGAALFFFSLSTMIDKAKGIQNENDLTI